MQFDLKSIIYKIGRKFNPQFGYWEDDVMLVTFPKSGTNWACFLLANYFTEYSDTDKKIEINFHNFRDWVSTTHLQKPPTDVNFPRMVHSHSEYEGQKTKVIYIMRHPADVMESYYFYLRDRWNKDVSTFSTFIRNQEYGIPAWIRHINSWEENIDLLVRYEDLKKDTHLQLRRMIEFLGQQPESPLVDKAVKKSSFQNMKRIEKKYGYPSKRDGNDNFTFMRKGKVSKGDKLFSDKDYEYLYNMTSSILKKYNYSPQVLNY